MSEILTTDLLRQYLDEAARVPLLRHEEEADLFQRHHAGLAARAILDAEAEVLPRRRAVLRRVVVEGGRAAERLAWANLRLVVSIARTLGPRDVELMDRIQEGNLGLLRAIARFEPTKGYKFSTYATWWIRQAMQRDVNDRTVRVPRKLRPMIRDLRVATDELTQHLSRVPTSAELARALEWTPEELRDAQAAAVGVASLDQPLGSDGASVLGDLVPDDRAEDPEERAMRANVPETVADLLDRLEPTERLVLELRFGLGGGSPATLDQIGDVIGVSRERVRQIERSTLLRLRHLAPGDRAAIAV